MKLNKEIPIEVSARHIHLSQKDLEELFRVNYELKVLKQLLQFGEFACEETLTINSGSKKIDKVRIIGPARKNTQIEISHADARFLNINPPIRISGDIENTPGIRLINQKKEIFIKRGVIIPQRHIHCNPKEAKELGFKDGMLVSVRTNSIKPVTFHNIVIKIKENYSLCLHLDVEEGNAAGILNSGKGVILGIEE